MAPLVSSLGLFVSSHKRNAEIDPGPFHVKHLQYILPVINIQPDITFFLSLALIGSGLQRHNEVETYYNIQNQLREEDKFRSQGYSLKGNKQNSLCLLPTG
jgi:hypothetical protein